MYQHFLHGVPTSLIPRLHGAATALETALRTWCPGLRFPAAAGTTASAMGDGCCCGCATPSSLLGAALHGDGGDNADTECMPLTPRHNDDTVCMRASSRVASELWPVLWTTKTAKRGLGFRVHIYM